MITNNTFKLKPIEEKPLISDRTVNALFVGSDISFLVRTVFMMLPKAFALTPLNQLMGVATLFSGVIGFSRMRTQYSAYVVAKQMGDSKAQQAAIQSCVAQCFLCLGGILVGVSRFLITAALLKGYEVAPFAITLLGKSAFYLALVGNISFCFFFIILFIPSIAAYMEQGSFLTKLEVRGRDFLTDRIKPNLKKFDPQLSLDLNYHLERSRIKKTTKMQRLVGSILTRKIEKGDVNINEIKKKCHEIRKDILIGAAICFISSAIFTLSFFFDNTLMNLALLAVAGMFILADGKAMENSFAARVCGEKDEEMIRASSIIILVTSLLACVATYLFSLPIAPLLMVALIAGSAFLINDYATTRIIEEKKASYMLS